MCRRSQTLYHSAAQLFFALYRSKQESFYEEELLRLKSITSPLHMNSNEIVELFTWVKWYCSYYTVLLCSFPPSFLPPSPLPPSLSPSLPPSLPPSPPLPPSLPLSLPPSLSPYLLPSFPPSLSTPSLYISFKLCVLSWFYYRRNGKFTIRMSSDSFQCLEKHLQVMYGHMYMYVCILYAEWCYDPLTLCMKAIKCQYIHNNYIHFCCFRWKMRLWF